MLSAFLITCFSSFLLTFGLANEEKPTEIKIDSNQFQHGLFMPAVIYFEDDDASTGSPNISLNPEKEETQDQVSHQEFIIKS